MPVKKTHKKKIKNVGVTNNNYNKYTIKPNKNKNKNKSNNKKLNNNIINPPLSKDRLQGTAESVGDMNYFYQNYSNIFRFFYILKIKYSHTKEYNLVKWCLPHFGNIKIGSYAALTFNLDTDFSDINPAPTDKTTNTNEKSMSIR